MLVARTPIHSPLKSTISYGFAQTLKMSVDRWALAGWFMFTLSGVFFLSDAVAAGDKTAIGSAVTWLVGVVFFVQSMRGSNDAEQSPNQPDA